MTFSKMNKIIGLLLTLRGTIALEDNAAPACKKFREIYPSGREICEKMWSGSFKYETDEAKAYTMWFFDHDNNPNDAVTQRLNQSGALANFNSSPIDTCQLQYFHKEAVSSEPDDFMECHPWEKRACCKNDTVRSVKALKASYGPEYAWDRCGKLSSACERYFVQEACLYECEPNAGLFRKFPNSANSPQYKVDSPVYFDEANKDTNTWQMSGMPIRASYCNAWWFACKDDHFCAQDDGDYFSCAKAYVPFIQNAVNGTCMNRCGEKSVTDGKCGCDAACEATESCCEDRPKFCKATWTARNLGTCKGACGGKALDGPCYCDSACAKQGDCCEDLDLCKDVAGTCAGKCGKKSMNCFCDKVCSTQNPSDCCPDIASACPNL